MHLIKYNLWQRILISYTFRRESFRSGE